VHYVIGFPALEGCVPGCRLRLPRASDSAGAAGHDAQSNNVRQPKNGETDSDLVLVGESPTATHRSHRAFLSRNLKFRIFSATALRDSYFPIKKKLTGETQKVEEAHFFLATTTLNLLPPFALVFASSQPSLHATLQQALLAFQSRSTSTFPIDKPAS